MILSILILIFCVSAQDTNPMNATELARLEKENWIFGDGPKTPYEIKVQDIMWETNGDLQKVRGFLEGFTQGFYKNFTYKLEPKCMDKTTVRYLYYLREDLEHFSFNYVFEIMGLAYNLYFMYDFNCRVQQIFYDIAEWCFDHNCTPEQLIKNEMANVF